METYMLTNEDKYRITLNKITEALATKPRRNSDEDYILRHVKAVLLECHPDTSWWWLDKLASK